MIGKRKLKRVTDAETARKLLMSNVEKDIRDEERLHFDLELLLHESERRLDQKKNSRYLLKQMAKCDGDGGGGSAQAISTRTAFSFASSRIISVSLGILHQFSEVLPKRQTLQAWRGR